MAKVFGEYTDAQGHEFFSICYGGKHIRYVRLYFLQCSRMPTGKIYCRRRGAERVVDYTACDALACSSSDSLELWELPEDVLRTLGFWVIV